MKKCPYCKGRFLITQKDGKFYLSCEFCWFSQLKEVQDLSDEDIQEHILAQHSEQPTITQMLNQALKDKGKPT